MTNTPPNTSKCVPLDDAVLGLLLGQLVELLLAVIVDGQQTGYRHDDHRRTTAKNLFDASLVDAADDLLQCEVLLRDAEISPAADQLQDGLPRHSGQDQTWNYPRIRSEETRN